MPKNEEKQASENSDERMPAADAQQRMIGWAERVLQNFTPADAMNVPQFANVIGAQPPMRYSITEYHEKIDVTEDVPNVAKGSDAAKLLMDPVTQQIEFGGLNEGGEAYINTAPRGMPATTVYAAISFDAAADGIPELKKLNAFDECVLENIFTLILENIASDGTLPLISVSQLCLAMTNGKTRGGRLYEQVKASIKKMKVTTITIDNTDEVDEGADYPLSDITNDYLLPAGERTRLYKGREETVIYLRGMPALLAFACGRNQIATIDRKIATCPGKHTPKRQNVYRYLLGLILRNNGPKAIKIETICERCNITGVKERQRLPAELKEFFVYLKQCDAIENYKFIPTNKQPEKIAITRKKTGQKRLENRH